MVDTSTGPDRPDLRLGTPPGDGSRSRRSGARAILILFLLAVIAVAFGAFQAGQQRADNTAAPTPTSTGGTGAFAATGTSAPTATSAAPTTAPPKPRVLTLITKNLGTEENPDRVYVARGQKGTHPQFVVRPGERIQVRVDNQDTVIHSWTFAKTRQNLEAWEDAGPAPLSEISTTKPFLAPRTPGTYTFYCRYRKVGMSGTLIVRG